jgi:hypothetical protein
MNKSVIQDNLSRNMQNEIIKIASERLGYPLADNLVSKVQQLKWSYTGLEMIMNSVKTIDVFDIENYLLHID